MNLTKYFGEGCRIKDNCRRYLESIKESDYVVEPMYSSKTRKCMNFYPERITKSDFMKSANDISEVTHPYDLSRKGRVK